MDLAILSKNSSE